MRHLLEIDDLTAEELGQVLALAQDPAPPRVLAGKGMALVFEKPSARTRSSMEMAVVQLGGHPMAIRGDEVGLDSRESVEDVTRTLGCYHAAIGARVFAHSFLERMSALDVVPIVNLLSDDAHPMQALADLLTLRQHLGEDLTGRSVAYVGDGNNVCRSLMLASAMAGMDVRVAAPSGFQPSAADVDRAVALGGSVAVSDRPIDAVEGADAVYTDVWVSMGQEAESTLRLGQFEGFSVDATLMEAAPDALFLHCLPAHRGEEVAADVVDGPRSVVWQQAENRMHAARGLLAWLLGRAAG